MPYTRAGVPHQLSFTSQAAAETITHRRFQDQQDLILQTLLKVGTRGRTDEELQNQLGMDGNSERPARVALWDKGLIQKTDETRPTKRKHQAAVWVATAVMEGPPTPQGKRTYITRSKPPTPDQVKAYLGFVQQLYTAFPEGEGVGAEVLLSADVLAVQGWLKGLSR